MPEGNSFKVTLELDAGKSEVKRSVGDGDPVVEFEVTQFGVQSAQIFLRTQGNHAGAEVIEASHGKLKQLWENSSAGGITYSDFGTFCELLVGRTAAQVGLNTKISKLGSEFQEVYIVSGKGVRFFGIRRRRSRMGRTLPTELIPGASAD